uniref:Protein kinase domain-containing protein n=1 Tax=Caenorhabditis tropicalis TaxID=1561998 RepID=A0A1I7U1W8_9PELO
MSKRNLGTMETDSQNMEEHPEKLSRSNAPVASPTAINQLPTTSRQSTSNQGSSGKAPSLQVPTIKISCAELDSVPEDEYGENGFARIDIEQEIGGQFDTLKFLGFGAYATIWLVKNRVDGKYEALKITKSNPDYEETVMREVQFMNYMIKLGTHENIVEFLGFTEINVDRAIHQVLRFEVLGPNLDEVLQSELKFHPDVLKNMIKQLLKAVEYIHRQHIIHMDIKTENIMFAICDEDIQMMAIRSYASNNIYHLDLTSADSKFTLKLADLDWQL